ncbi:MAG: insulinase family protein, partial [Firmicutes bacterium]|nr:insulinase family protein [Bacillota bacterium]
MYPVSSKNEQDFINLTRVYLDAVFRPAIYHKDSIFRQEGWHYEIEEDEPFYNGVVFNEMKGAYASVDTHIEDELQKALFPDSIYGFQSGGYPPEIPDLTYENFLRAHSEFYSPSNCRIFLDGALPLERVLTIIDDEYLSTFEKDDRTHEIAMQAPVETQDRVRFYEIGKDEDEANKCHLVLGKVFSDWESRKRNIAYTLMSIYLAGDNEAPLKRAILERGLAQDVEFSVMDGIAQPFYVIVFRNMESSNNAEVLKVYKETLEKILREGVDKDALTGCINRFEFSLRESGEPQGLYRVINAMSSWLYGGDPMLYLESDHLVHELRDALDTDLYTDIIKELLDEEGLVRITMLPSKTKGDEDAEKEYERVTKEYSSLSEAELKEVEAAYERMRKWQDTPDSPEAVAKLPVLQLSDVDPRPQWTEPEVREKNGVKFLYEPIFTNGVVHVNMYFNIADLSIDELRMMSAMTEFLGLLPTSKHTAAELQKETRKLFGGLDYNAMSPWVKGHIDRTKPFFTVSFSVLEENLEAAEDLVIEILTETDFDNRDTIMENLLQCREVIYQSIMSAGNQFAARRVLSNYSASTYIEERLSGYDFLLFVRKLLDGFAENAPELI